MFQELANKKIFSYIKIFYFILEVEYINNLEMSLYFFSLTNFNLKLIEKILKEKIHINLKPIKQTNVSEQA